MMNLLLKQDPVWLDCLTTPATSPSLHLLGGDGQQVAVAVPVLLAASPVVKGIFTDHILPSYCPYILSLPATTGGVLQVFVDLLTTGAAASAHRYQMEEVKQVFEMLGVEADIVSYHPKNIKILDVKAEIAAEESNVCWNEEKISQLENIVKIEEVEFMDVLDIKEESAAEESDVGLNDDKISQVEKIVKIEDAENTTVLAIEESKTLACTIPKKSSLIVKIPSASGIDKNKYHCNLCSKNFRVKYEPRKHVCCNIQCKFCPQKFSKKPYLSAHVKAVHDKSQISPQKFSWELALNVHVDSLHKVREHPCILCQQKFTTKRKLVSHLKSVHSKVLFPCSLCRKKFSSKAGLKTHFNSVH